MQHLGAEAEVAAEFVLDAAARNPAREVLAHVESAVLITLDRLGCNVEGVVGPRHAARSINEERSVGEPNAASKARDIAHGAAVLDLRFVADGGRAVCNRGGHGAVGQFCFRSDASRIVALGPIVVTLDTDDEVPELLIVADMKTAGRAVE